MSEHEDTLQIFIRDVNKAKDVDADMKNFVNNDFPILLKVMRILRIPI